MKVYVVLHNYDRENRGNVFGIYSNKETASEAAKKYNRLWNGTLVVEADLDNMGNL